MTVTIPTLNNTNPPPEVTEGAQPVEADSYFYLDGSFNHNKAPNGATYAEFVKFAVQRSQELA